MTPKDLSIGHFLKELFLAKPAEIPAWDVNAAYFHLINVELLHHPHCPVDHLVSTPEHGVCVGKEKQHTLSHMFDIDHCKGIVFPHSYASY